MHRSALRMLRWFAAGLCLCSAAPAGAQTPVLQPDRLPAFGRSIAGTDDSTATLLNPANLAYLPSWELRWEGVYLQENVKAPWQGHAFSFAVPLPFSFATAFRLDFVDPPANAFAPGFQDNYQWFTWALAYAPSETFSVGMSLQRSFSDSPVSDRLGSYSLALTTRPVNEAGFSVVAQNISGPLTGENVDRLEALGVDNVTLGPTIDTALALRPSGTRQFEIGLEGRYLHEPSKWIPRAVVGVDVPYVGRVRGDFAMSDPAHEDRAWTASASLSLYANSKGGSTDLEGGFVTGNGLGASDSYNFFNGVAFRGWTEPVGFKVGRYGVRIRIEETPGTREHVALLRTLWRVAEDKNVDAVLFELRDSPAASLGRDQELRDAVGYLQSHGKKVLCHLEDGSGSALYLCSAADRILINPAGGLRVAGLRTRHFYLKGLLDKVGVRADFVRIGPHKSAPEQFTRESASQVARADKIDLLQQYERQFVVDIAHGRHLEPGKLREILAKGPFISTEAKQAGLVDGYAFDDQLEEETSKLVGHGIALRDKERLPHAHDHFSRRQSIALVYVEGDMVNGRSRTIPLLGMKLAGGYTLAETIKKVRENPFVAAMVLRVETPGGSSMAADVIWREVALTAKVKPVIVSMGAIAASGGYYIAAPGTRIFANPLTLTGSIGVFYGKADVSGLLRKLGVNVETYKTAPRADAESLFRPFTPEERRELRRKVGQFYGTFLDRVSEGRNMTRKQVDAVGRGRVWTGAQAKDRGLVDELGGLRQALAYARKVAHLEDDAPIVELPEIEQSLIGRLLGIEWLHSKAGQAQLEALPPQLLDMARTMAPFLVHPSDRPLMRAEFVEIEP